jgi:hypothetical protein
MYDVHDREDQLRPVVGPARSRRGPGLVRSGAVAAEHVDRDLRQADGALTTLAVLDRLQVPAAVEAVQLPFDTQLTALPGDVRPAQAEQLGLTTRGEERKHPEGAHLVSLAHLDEGRKSSCFKTTRRETSSSGSGFASSAALRATRPSRIASLSMLRSTSRTRLQERDFSGFCDVRAVPALRAVRRPSRAVAAAWSAAGCPAIIAHYVGKRLAVAGSSCRPLSQPSEPVLRVLAHGQLAATADEEASGVPSREGLDQFSPGLLLRAPSSAEPAHRVISRVAAIHRPVWTG